MAVAADKITLPSRDPKEFSSPLSFWLPEEFKASDIDKKRGIISSYLTVYTDPSTGKPFVDSYLDIIEPGSFTKTIKDLSSARASKNNPYLCAYLWQHDRKELIGGVKNLIEDSKGVIYEAQINMDVQRGREAFALAEQKMIGSSYGYDPIRFQHKGDIRHLLEIRLHEASLVSFPANPHANILDTKEDQDRGQKNFYVPSNMPEFPAMPVHDFKDDLDHGTPTNVVKDFAKKADDFATAWMRKEPSQLVSEFFKMTDCLTMVLLQNFNDDGLDDKIAMIEQCCSQFSNECKDWYPEYQAADDALDKIEGDDGDEGPYDNMPMSMIGLYSADMSSLNMKRTLDYVQSKAGRSLSERNRKRLRQAIEAMAGQLSDLQSLLSDADVQEPNDDTAQQPPSSDIQQDITQGVAVLSTLSPDAGTHVTSQAPPENTPEQPISFPELPDTGELDITDLLASIQLSMHNGGAS